MVYATISKEILKMFACQRFGNKRYLIADYSIDCDDAEHFIFRSFGSAVTSQPRCTCHCFLGAICCMWIICWLFQRALLQAVWGEIMQAAYCVDSDVLSRLHFFCVLHLEPLPMARKLFGCRAIRGIASCSNTLGMYFYPAYIFWRTRGPQATCHYNSNASVTGAPSSAATTVVHAMVAHRVGWRFVTFRCNFR